MLNKRLKVEKQFVDIDLQMVDVYFKPKENAI